MHTVIHNIERTSHYSAWVKGNGLRWDRTCYRSLHVCHSPQSWPRHRPLRCYLPNEVKLKTLSSMKCMPRPPWKLMIFINFSFLEISIGSKVSKPCSYWWIQQYLLWKYFLSSLQQHITGLAKAYCRRVVREAVEKLWIILQLRLRFCFPFTDAAQTCVKDDISQDVCDSYFSQNSR